MGQAMTWRQAAMPRGRHASWKRWSLLMKPSGSAVKATVCWIALTLAFLAFGYRHSIWEWWHFQVHQPIIQKQYEAL
jgi:hypothetical protein